jgi:GMP synthase (glutamine-hydrolysing)
MKIQVLQHVLFEGPGHIENWVHSKNFQMTKTCLWKNEVMPGLDTFEWLVIMGGPMNVDEEEKYPWLADEKRLIRQSVEAGKVVLGICLGAQLIADTLGAKIYPNKQKEIGWFSIELTPESRNSRILQGLPELLTVFHWHGDTFDIPPGAVRLAGNNVCINQAFSYGRRVLGLQFHLESTPETVRLLTEHCHGDLLEGPTVQSIEEMQIQKDAFENLQRHLFCVLDNLYENAMQSTQMRLISTQ